MLVMPCDTLNSGSLPTALYHHWNTFFCTDDVETSKKTFYLVLLERCRNKVEAKTPYFYDMIILANVCGPLCVNGMCTVAGTPGTCVCDEGYNGAVCDQRMYSLYFKGYFTLHRSMIFIMW